MTRHLFNKIIKLHDLYFLKRRLHSCLIDIHPDVQNAFNKNIPVLSLESTILTHGMPYPHNVKTALEVQNIARKKGVVPATIAVINGRIKVGLDNEEIEMLGDPANQAKTIKTSRRDLPYVLSQKLSGGTTVSGTLLVSALVGIPLFVTGGIGGVHYDGENSMDVSADLVELGRHSIMVVSAGVKSILDIGRTLEYLETQGVCVVTYGPTKVFPSFYNRESHHEAPYYVTNAQDAAGLLQKLQELNAKSGILLGVPIPEDYEYVKSGEMSEMITSCLDKCRRRNIRGKLITPFLLDEIAKMSQGKSLEANIGLIKNNVLVGAQILQEWHKLRNND